MHSPLYEHRSYSNSDMTIEVNNITSRYHNGTFSQSMSILFKLSVCTLSNREALVLLDGRLVNLLSLKIIGYHCIRVYRVLPGG